MSGVTRSRRMRQLQWLAIGLCTAAIAVNYLDRATIAIANVKIREEFGISATAMGALQSAWSICFAFAQIPTGFIVDRLGPYRLLGAALVLWSLAQTLGGFAHSYLQLIWARGILGMFEAPAYPTAVRVTSNWFRSEHRGAPTGVFNTGASIGQAIAPPLLTVLMLAFGWRMMFIVVGLVGVLFGIPNHKIANPPTMSVDELRLRGVLNEIAQQQPSLGNGPVDDPGSVRGYVQRLTARAGKNADQWVDRALQFFLFLLGELEAQRLSRMGDRVMGA